MSSTEETEYTVTADVGMSIRIDSSSGADASEEEILSKTEEVLNKLLSDIKEVFSINFCPENFGIYRVDKSADYKDSDRVKTVRHPRW